MQREDDTGRFVEEEAPDGTVVIYDSQNPEAWIQSNEPVELDRET